MIKLASRPTVLATITIQACQRRHSSAAVVAAILASVTAQLFSLNPAVAARPPAAARTQRVTGSARPRQRAADGTYSSANTAKMAIPATTKQANWNGNAVAPGDSSGNVSSPISAYIPIQTPH